MKLVKPVGMGESLDFFFIIERERDWRIAEQGEYKGLTAVLKGSFCCHVELMS